MEEFIAILGTRGILKVCCAYGIETIPIYAGNETVSSPTNISFTVLIFLLT
jgi:hypothetical protein